MEDNELEGIGTALDDAQSLSLLQAAAKKRQKRQRSLFLDVPSWGGDLVAEYRVVPPEEMRRVAETATRRMRNNGQAKPAEGDVAVIAAACVGLYLKDPETGERIPIEDQYGHVGYDRMAAVLGKDDKIKSVSETIRYLTAERGDNDDEWVENIMAISLHANAIGRWMRDPSKQSGVDMEDLLGEY